VSAQTPKADSLLRVIQNSSVDTVKAKAYADLGAELMGEDVPKSESYLDEAIRIANLSQDNKGLAYAYNIKGRLFAQQGKLQEAMQIFEIALNQFRSIGDKTGEANVLSNLGSIYYRMGNNKKALEHHFQSLKISEEIGNTLRIATSYNNIGTVYQQAEATIDDALNSYKKALEGFTKIDNQPGMATVAMNIGEIYFLESKLDSAIQYHELALGLCDGTLDATFPLTQLGEIYGVKGEFNTALPYHRRALSIAESLDAKYEVAQSLIGYAKTLKRQADIEGTIAVLERAKKIAIEIDAKNELLNAYMELSEIYAMKEDFEKAYTYELEVKKVSDDISKSSTEQMVKQLQFDFELSQKQAEIELLQKDTELKNAAVFNQRIIIFTALGGLVLFIAISIFLFRNNLSKQKANSLLQAQKEEIREQREKVESAFDQLKSAQAQLIQSEKMASLGELTAGIAHEIRNPLNFVNNFSEVSNELIVEVLDERDKPAERRNEKLIADILGDIKENLEKINHHGKRADAIVQGMLQHSRTSTGEKAMTDINALAAEYLRLSYHGMQAKDNAFNVQSKSYFDPNLPKMKVIPQDIGRVFLNIINNAFQACVNYQPTSRDGKDPQPGDLYVPTVTVKTSLVKTSSGGLLAQVSIADNGPGIPESIKDKIFQPFFTTKPTGQGTGLGLSLSYDIIKAHGGEIGVESTVGKGTVFTVSLPV
jgi:signal transduction histidine kinase/Tfp pilus assembly protein PilF